ncbi:hypothetical protein ABK040_013989 [Willaertia magna]
MKRKQSPSSSKQKNNNNNNALLTRRNNNNNRRNSTTPTKNSPKQQQNNNGVSILTYFSPLNKKNIVETIEISSDEEDNNNNKKNKKNNEINNKKNKEINEEIKVLEINSQTSNVSINSQENDIEKRVPNYYLYHFLEILNTVMKRDGHLFLENEKKIICDIFQKELCQGSKRLFIRMFNRKKQWFTESELTLKYAKEIKQQVQTVSDSSIDNSVVDETVSDNNSSIVNNKDSSVVNNNCCNNVKSVLSHLLKYNFIKIFKKNEFKENVKSEEEDDIITIDELKDFLNELTVKDLKLILEQKSVGKINKQEIIKQILLKPQTKQKSIANFFKKNESNKKNEITKKEISNNEINEIKESNNNELLGVNDLIDNIMKSLNKKEKGICFYRINRKILKLFKLIHHLYFLSQVNDASVMVLEMKNIVKYPKVEIQEHGSIFEKREDLLRYEEAIEFCRDWIEENLNNKGLSSNTSSVPASSNTSSNMTLQVENQTTQDALIIDLESQFELISKGQEKTKQVDSKDISENLQILLNFLLDIKEKMLKEVELLKIKYENQKDKLKLDYYLLRFNAGYIYARMISQGIKLLEKNKQYTLAIEYMNYLLQSPYLIGKRGEFYNRIALDYEHLKKNDEALKVCEKALQLNNNVNNQSSTTLLFNDMTLPMNKRYTLEKRYIRLKSKINKSKKKNKKDNNNSTTEEEENQNFIGDQLQSANEVNIQGKLKPLDSQQSSSGKKSTFLSYKDELLPVSVEQLTLEFYELAHCYKGIHTEGSVWAMLFILLLWDIIFDSSIPFVFRSKYQSAPLDFCTDAFYERRKEKILDRLKEYEEKGNLFIVETVKCVWEENYGVKAVCCNWGIECDDIMMEENLEIITKTTSTEQLQNLTEICECFSPKVICTILKMLAEDFKENRSGMPDLTLWKLKEKCGKLCEVKGPNDKLSDKQTIWIDVLLRAGCQVDICHVVAKETTIVNDSVIEPKKKKRKSNDLKFDDEELWTQLDFINQKEESHELTTIVAIDDDEE